MRAMRAISRADLLADGGSDLLRTGDDGVGLACRGDHLQAGLLVRDAGEVDLDIHPGSGRRGAGSLGTGSDIGDDVAVTDRRQRLGEIHHHPRDADDLGRRPGRVDHKRTQPEFPAYSLTKELYLHKVPIFTVFEPFSQVPR